MKSALLLFLQLVIAVALFVVVPSPFGILQENPVGWLKFYQETAELFAIPFCLLIFAFNKKPLFLALRLGWGLWTALLSAGLLWDAAVQFPEITEFGQMLIAFNAVFGFALALTSLMELNKLFPGEDPAKLSFPNGKNQSMDSPIDLVEGA
ncbi:MAG: hypothetical protein ACKN9V_08835 [Pseudomonadota bacterium]